MIPASTVACRLTRQCSMMNTLRFTYIHNLFMKYVGYLTVFFIYRNFNMYVNTFTRTNFIFESISWYIMVGPS